MPCCPKCGSFDSHDAGPATGKAHLCACGWVYDDDDERCPVCNYTCADAMLHFDHRLCSEYPFFEWERK